MTQPVGSLVHASVGGIAPALRGGAMSMRARQALSARTLLGAALAVVALAAASGRARAQEAVWIASRAEQLESWYPAARAALEAEGVLVSEAGSGDEPCAPEQARRAARARGALRGVCVDVELAGARATAVTIELAGHGDSAAQGRAQTAHGDAAAATREAYRRALMALELGAAGLVRVRTTPEGAVVAFDGEPGGHAPLERRLAPGEYRIELALDGFAAVQRSVQVARGRVVEVDVRLQRLARGESPARSERSPLNYILGGALLVGAVPLLAISLSALARDGDCAEERAGVCTERVRFGTRSGLLLGAGAVALAAGAYLVLAAPIEVEVRADASGAGLALRTRAF